MRHLFDAELKYRPGMAPVAENGDGRLIGSGDGWVEGPALKGTLRWTLFEHPGELACAMNPALVIETDDGARITVEGRGFARRESTSSTVWDVAAALRFAIDDERYRWLGAGLAVWQGEFDAAAHRARYRAYAE